MELIVCRETPIASPSCCWESSWPARRSRTSFLMGRWKASLTSTRCQACFPCTPEVSLADAVGRLLADPLAQRVVADPRVDAGLVGPRAAVAVARRAHDAQRAGGVAAEHRAARVALAG